MILHKRLLSAALVALLHPLAVQAACNDASSCFDCLAATPDSADFCTWFQDIGFCEEGCGMEGCGATQCSEDITTCSECLKSGDPSFSQWAWVPDTEQCVSSCSDPMVPADGSCFAGSSYGPEVCPPPCGDFSTCEECLESGCAYSEGGCYDDCSDPMVPADGSCFDGNNYGPEDCPASAATPASAQIQECPSGDGGRCDFEPTNPHACGPDYGCSYSTICAAEAAGFDISMDCCQAPQESSCGFIFEPLICGNKECPYSNLCLAELAGYEESQCETPPEECPVSTNDCSAEPSNPFTCGSLKCAYGSICEVGGAGFDIHECCQDTRLFSPCPTISEPVSCGPPGGKQCGYDSQCLADAAGYNENQCCRLVPEATSCILMDAPVECGAIPCVYTNQCEATAAGYSEFDCCPQPIGGSCSLIYDPVVCGAGDCTYSSQSCADLAGWTSGDCSRINGPDCAALASCSDCLETAECSWSPDSGPSGMCVDSCTSPEVPADSSCYDGGSYGPEVCPEEPSCEDFTSCGDCLESSDCAWAPDVGCLEDCSMIADTACFDSDTYGPDMCQVSWVQVGSTLKGSENGDSFGNEVTLTSSGTRFSVAASKSSESGLNEAGMVRVYDVASNGDFVQVGQTLYGSRESDEVKGKISGNGEYLILYTHKRDNATGRLWIYQLSGGTWIELYRIIGPQLGGRFGQDAVISSDGTFVAVGASFANDKKGVVLAYSRQSGTNTWIQMGSTIDGKYKNGKDGWRIALDDEGLIMAIGQKSDDSPDNTGRAGEVRIFRWSNSMNDWKQYGNTVFGDNPGDAFGRTVALSADGQMFAAGARYHDSVNGDNSGQVKAFSIDGGSWNGYPDNESEMIGEAAGDEMMNLAMNAGGDVIIAGGGTAENAYGNVRGFMRTEDGWVHFAQKLTGQEAGEMFGSNLSLSSNGQRLLVGSPSGENPNIKARVRLYEICYGSNCAGRQPPQTASAGDEPPGDSTSPAFRSTALATAAFVAALAPALY